MASLKKDDVWYILVDTDYTYVANDAVFVRQKVHFGKK